MLDLLVLEEVANKGSLRYPHFKRNRVSGTGTSFVAWKLHRQCGEGAVGAGGRNL